MGNITLEMTCNTRENANVININYLVVDALSPYNVILGRSAIIFLGEIISIQYLVLKLLLPNGWVRTVWEDQNHA